MKSEDMKDEWEEADAKQQQQVEEHGESSFPHTAWFREVVKLHGSAPTDLPDRGPSEPDWTGCQTDSDKNVIGSKFSGSYGG